MGLGSGVEGGEHFFADLNSHVAGSTDAGSVQVQEKSVLAKSNGRGEETRWAGDKGEFNGARIIGPDAEDDRRGRAQPVSVCCEDSREPYQ